MIIADENIDSRLISLIREIPIDVLSIAESYSGISDLEIIQLSKEPAGIILTEDKDFGEWVFAHNIKDVSVIFLRYNFKDYETIGSILKQLLISKIEKIKGSFTTITVNKVRIRKL